MIVLGREERIHRVTAPKRELKRLQQHIKDYYDPEKVMGFSRKKKKIVMKYPRKTFWRKYWARRNKKKN